MTLFPSVALKQSLRKAVSVELKDGTTYNGVLTSADKWMNLVLVDVTITHRSGDQFFKSASACIRGSAVRTTRVVREALAAPAENSAREDRKHLNKAERAAKYSRAERAAN